MALFEFTVVVYKIMTSMVLSVVLSEALAVLK